MNGDIKNNIAYQDMDAFRKRECVYNQYFAPNSELPPFCTYDRALPPHISSKTHFEFYQCRNRLIDMLSSIPSRGYVPGLKVFYHFESTMYNLSFYQRYIDRLNHQDLNFLSNDIKAPYLVNDASLKETREIFKDERKDIKKYFADSSSQDLTIPSLKLNGQYEIPINCIPEHLLIYQYNNRLDFSNAKLAEDGIHVKRRPSKTLSRYDAYKEVYKTVSKALPIPKFNFEEETYSQEEIIRNYLTVAHRLWIDELFKFPEIHQISTLYSLYSSNKFLSNIRKNLDIAYIDNDTYEMQKGRILHAIFDPSFVKEGICSKQSLNFFYYFNDYINEHIAHILFNNDYKANKRSNTTLDENKIDEENIDTLLKRFNSWEQEITNYLHSNQNQPLEEAVVEDDIQKLLIKLYDNPVFKDLYLDTNIYDLDTIFSSDIIRFDKIEDIFPFDIDTDVVADNSDKE